MVQTHWKKGWTSYFFCWVVSPLAGYAVCMSLLCIYLRNTLHWYTLLAYISSKKALPRPNMAAYWALSAWQVSRRERWQTISNTLAGYGWTLTGWSDGRLFLKGEKGQFEIRDSALQPCLWKSGRDLLSYTAVLWQSHYGTFWTLLKQNSCIWICVGVCNFFYTCTFKYVSVYYCKTKRGDRRWHQQCTMH